MDFLNEAVGIIASPCATSTGRYTVTTKAPAVAIVSYPSGVKIKANNMLVVSKVGVKAESCGPVHPSAPDSNCANPDYCTEEGNKLLWLKELFEVSVYIE
jgi:hypothetical protein